jgi:hypothetical protein
LAGLLLLLVANNKINKNKKYANIPHAAIGILNSIDHGLWATVSQLIDCEIAQKLLYVKSV